MQKFVSKYALAAHLSLLTAAPLLMSPFFPKQVVAQVLLWLSLVCATWVLMCPSIRPDELAHDARRRVLVDVLRDPLFWTSLGLVAFSALRWLNGGIEMVYDAEVDADELVLNMGQYNAGIYMVSITTVNGTTVKRVVVTK